MRVLVLCAVALVLAAPAQGARHYWWTRPHMEAEILAYGIEWGDGSYTQAYTASCNGVRTRHGRSRLFFCAIVGWRMKGDRNREVTEYVYARPISGRYWIGWQWEPPLALTR